MFLNPSLALIKVGWNVNGVFSAQVYVKLRMIEL